MCVLKDEVQAAKNNGTLYQNAEGGLPLMVTFHCLWL